MKVMIVCGSDYEFEVCKELVDIIKHPDILVVNYREGGTPLKFEHNGGLIDIILYIGVPHLAIGLEQQVTSLGIKRFNVDIKMMSTILSIIN